MRGLRLVKRALVARDGGEEGGEGPGSQAVLTAILGPPLSRRGGIAIKRFKVRYPKLEVDEDPFVELPSNAEVPAPTEIPFDNRPATPPTLPPSS
ncbi:hypothetical protein BHM03_00059683 [Ensete ventricosum]|nr:hypothetical protein BHM03_00059683 [Ensete ventricosum]